jgi:hypothetical protein
MMITRPEFDAAVKRAYEVMESYCGNTGARAASFLSPFKGRREAWAVRLAKQAAGVDVWPFLRLPSPGFASWIMLLPSPVIAVDEAQIQAWASKTRVSVSAQRTRTIIHEVGHLLLHDRLRKDPVGFAVPATANEEQQAWVFAMSVLSLILGDYSRTGSVGDDCPSMML